MYVYSPIHFVFSNSANAIFALEDLDSLRQSLRCSVAASNIIIWMNSVGLHVPNKILSFFLLFWIG